VAGSLALVDENGEEPAGQNDATVLQFVPSGPLPANTTFEVALATSITSLDAGALAKPITWSFTTGAPHATLSNQVAFLSDRGGVPNLWTMNPDGSAPRQVSAELTPILDYAVAPDGSSFVVGDGRRLVYASASGADRRVLTDDGLLEFDPTYAPNGQRIAFGRADAETGLALGLWERSVDGGDATRIEIGPDPSSASPGPAASGSDGTTPEWLRAPRFASDGSALAFVDLAGTVGILDLESGSVVRVRHEALSPPAWLPDASAVLITGRTLGRPLRDPVLGEVVEPLEPSGPVEVAVLDRSGSILEPSRFGSGARVAAVASDGRIAYLRADGSLRLADGPDESGAAIAGMVDERVSAVSFAPGEDAVVLVTLPVAGGDGVRGRIERVVLVSGERAILANDGWRPRWLP
jgi:WD40-like Beta Propeller Repeat